VRAPGPSAHDLALSLNEAVPDGEAQAVRAVDYEEALRLDDARKSLRLRRGAQTVRGDGGAVGAAPGHTAEVRPHHTQHPDSALWLVEPRTRGARWRRLPAHHHCSVGVWRGASG
jgi:hypothetical protein